MRDSVPSSRQDSDFVISQCHYLVASADGAKNLSVHLEVRRDGRGSEDKNALGDFWQKQFREAKEKKKSEKPKPVAGVGDEAYWVGNSRAGALYALKKGAIVRVSVGGPDTVDVKIEKSKKLAHKALQRLG